jgi:uncharacterized protein with von Willebrand factor type A (vWA) domain
LSVLNTSSTTFDVLLNRLPNQYWPEMIANGLPRGKTDVIVITDGQARMPEEQAVAFSAWAKKEQVKLHAILIDARCERLEQLADEVHCVRSLSPTSTAAEMVLSV